MDGQVFSQVRRTSYEIKLRYGQFDPVIATPEIPAELRADSSAQVYIVQFVIQPLRELRELISELGGTMYDFLPENAFSRAA